MQKVTHSLCEVFSVTIRIVSVIQNGMKERQDTYYPSVLLNDSRYHLLGVGVWYDNPFDISVRMFWVPRKFCLNNSVLYVI